jgi:DUF1680 family protein
MNSKTGPVINLYNAATITAKTPNNKNYKLDIISDYPKSDTIVIKIATKSPEKFSIQLRIPLWSKETSLKVNGKVQEVTPGSYKNITQKWSTGDKIELILDMRCRLINAPHGSNREGDNFQALIKGPVVLARDENIDQNYKLPALIISKDGYVDVIQEAPSELQTWMQYRVPTQDGFIHLVDYASVNNWNGKHICTWLPKPMP